jgi:hypothetical protein
VITPDPPAAEPATPDPPGADLAAGQAGPARPSLGGLVTVFLAVMTLFVLVNVVNAVLQWLNRPAAIPSAPSTPLPTLTGSPFRSPG